jgi:class 3 adenylate cyclase
MNALRALSILWLVSQVWDTAWVWTASGTPQTPSALLLISVSMIYMSYRERVRSERLESASARVLSLIEGNTPIRDLVTQVGRIVAGETEFPRVSAYIDAFCVGAHDHPHQVFLRVLDQGYKKDTQKDSVITFGEGRGMFMAQALETQSCVMRQGKQDKAWFISMAIGKHACLNLSHDSPSSSEQAFARLETLERLRPALQTLDRRLVAAGLEQSSTLQRLRSVRGDGSWEIEAGSIFVDINNYSKFSETFGLRFTGFVSNTYFPALVKAVSALALPEHVVGDEAHLLIVPDILPVEMDVAKGVVKSLSEIDRFVREAGAHLCENNGFDQLTLSIGVNVGRVTLVCDGIRVRTAGQVINEAKRLQDEAGKAGILVHGAVRLPISDSAYREGETFPILVKKNLITATRLLRYQKPDSSAA